MKKLVLGDIHWTVSDVMDVIRGLCVTHLDELTLNPICDLRDSPLPEEKHLCHVNTLTWQAPVDILVMRTLLECFPSDSVKLDKCKILYCESEKIAINSPPREMVSLYHSIKTVNIIGLLLTHGGEMIINLLTARGSTLVVRI